MPFRFLPAALLSTLFFTATATAEVRYVDAGLMTGANDGTSWADAYQGSGGLQTARAAAVSGDEIYVAEGTYLPASNGARTASFVLKNGVEIYGGFLGTESSPAERPPFGSAPSVLDGDLAGNDGMGVFSENSYHVVSGAGTNASAVLDGFTVRGGNANGSGNNNKGGGILCLSGASPTVRNCRFTSSRCTFGGGAGYINSSAPSFTDCSFENNIGGSYGGAFDIATAGAVRFDRCSFTGNRAARAGALEVFATSGVVVTNSLFRGNTSTGSGGGGAIWMGNGGNTQLRCCTVVANFSSVNQAAGLLVQGASPSVVNGVFWDNAGPGGAQNAVNQISGTTNVTYSIVEGGLAGVGNLDTDPLFTDPMSGDLTLTIGSPAIDAGNNGGVPGGITLDLAGNPRFADVPSVPDTGSGTPPVVDIGAYEYPVPTAVAFCFGDGSGTACPCSNPGAGGNGCENGSFPGGSNLTASGSPSVGNDTFVLLASQSTPNQPGIFFQGDIAINNGDGITFGDGLRCAGMNVCRIEVANADGAGAASSTISIAAKCGLVAGDQKSFQWWYRDPMLSLCGSGFNLSNGLEVTWTP